MQKTAATLRNFLRRNRLFALLLAAELAVALALFVGLFGSAYTLEISGADFTNDYPKAATLDGENNALKIYNDGTVEEYEGLSFSFASRGLALPSGAYKVEVSYFSCQTPDNPTFNREYSAGSIRFESKKYDMALHADDIPLDDCHHSQNGRLWVGFASRMSDITVTVDYAEGQLYLYSIRFVEQPIYRVTRLVCFLVLAAVVDLLLWLAFAHVDADGVQCRKALRLPLALAGITFVACLPCFGDYLIGGQDINFHLQRIVCMANELGYGQFPVRMATDALNGYGYAAPLFYCDLFTLLPALLYNAWLPLRTCWQVYIVAVTLATAIISYGCFARILNSKRYGLLGALLYTLSAYRHTNVYIRSAMGEFTAMTFLPLVLLGLYLMYSEKKPRFEHWAPMAFGMAALVQCHLLSVGYTVIFLLIFCIVRLRKTLQPARLLAWIKAAALALGLSAWFFFPFLVTNSTTSFMVGMDIFMKKTQEQGLYWMQILSPFGKGISGSKPGPADMSLLLGLPLLVGVGMILYCLARREQWEGEHTAKYLYTTAAFALLTLVLTLECIPYDAAENWLGMAGAKLVGTFQFPWRILAFSTLLVVLATLFALYLIAGRYPQVGKILEISLVCCAFLYMGVAHMQVYAYGDYTEHNDVYRDNYSIVGDSEYLIAGTSQYETIWAQPKPGSEEMTLTGWERRGGKAYLSVENSGAEAPINVPIFNYGNYHAVDENGTEFAITSGENERLVLQIPAGYTGTITIWYQEPGYWRLFELTSALTLLGTVWYAVHSRRRSTEAGEA